MDQSLELEKKLDEKSLSILQERVKEHRPSVVIAYLLWAFVGGLGLHKFYIGKYPQGVVYLVSWGFGMALITSGGSGSSIGGLIILGVFIALIVDLFLLPSQIREYTDEKRGDIAQQLLD